MCDRKLCRQPGTVIYRAGVEPLDLCDKHLTDVLEKKLNPKDNQLWKRKEG